MKTKLLALLVGTIITANQQAHAFGAAEKYRDPISCDSKEFNNGILDETKYLYFNGYGQVRPSVEEKKRSVSPNEFLKNKRPSHAGDAGNIQQSLVDILSFHAEASLAKLSGITRNLVSTSNKIHGVGIEAVRAYTAKKGLTVSLKGNNESSMNCRLNPARSVNVNSAGSVHYGYAYLSVTNGGIIDPRSLPTYQCEMIGKLSDLAPNLFKVLRETFSNSATDKIAYEAAVKAGDQIKAYSEIAGTIIKKEDQFGSGHLIQMGPVNPFIVNADTSTRLLFSPAEELNAKAFVLSASGPCDMNLVCESSNCSFMSEDQLSNYYKETEKISTSK